MSTEPVMRRISWAASVRGAVQICRRTGVDYTLKTPASVKTRLLVTPIKNTAAILRPNATEALDSKIIGPTRIASWKGAMPSVKGRMMRLITATTYLWLLNLTLSGGFKHPRTHRRIVMK